MAWRSRGLVSPPRRPVGGLRYGGVQRGPLGPWPGVRSGLCCPASRAAPRRPAAPVLRVPPSAALAVLPVGLAVGGPPPGGASLRVPGGGFRRLRAASTGTFGLLGVLASACSLALAVAGPGSRSLSCCIQRNKGAPPPAPWKIRLTVHTDAAEVASKAKNRPFLLEIFRNVVHFADCRRRRLRDTMIAQRTGARRSA